MSRSELRVVAAQGVLYALWGQGWLFVANSQAVLAGSRPILKTAFLIAAFAFYAAGTVRLARASGPRWVTRTVLSAATAIVVGTVALIVSGALIGPTAFFHDAAGLRDVRSLAGGILVAAVVGGVLAIPIGGVARGGVATDRRKRKEESTA